MVVIFVKLCIMLVLFINAGVAQLVERLICNQLVGGSNPLASLKRFNMGRYPSGQREQTVNLLAKPSEVQILLSPIFIAGIAQLVEHQPSKLTVAGSNPVSRWYRI